jgi:hypothetical protein
MRSCLRVLALFAVAASRLLAQPASTPARLALVIEEPSLTTAADVLTVELSHRPGVQLFEREEINRVYREQQLSAANRDYLKLGQLLSADGLLVLGTMREGTNQLLTARLIATRPGVIISYARSPWPVATPSEWARGMASHLEPLLPKLTVLVKDAVPVSVVNLRSAMQTKEAPELERQLTLLSIERLSRERQLFVLERRKMQFLGAEHELAGLDESAFWKGSYLLEGTIDRDGYSAETVTINARLIPPQGGTPLAIDVSGSRTNLPEVIRQLTARVLENLKLQSSAPAWNAADEANQYFEEAKWASRWGLHEVAQAACESAWALGNRTKNLALLRVKIYTESALRPESPMMPANFDVPMFPDPAKLKTASRALELFCQNPLRNPTNPAALDLETFDTGLRALRTAARLLEGFYLYAESRPGNESGMAELRAWARQTAELLSAGEPDSRRNPGASIFSWDSTPHQLYQSVQWLKWEQGGIWQEKPEDGVPALRELIEHGSFPEDLPHIIGWSWKDRQRVPAILRRFVDDLCASTNPAVRLEGRYLALVRTPVDAEGNSANRESELYAEIWDQRRRLFEDAARFSVLPRTEEILRKKRFAFARSGPDERIAYAPFNQLVHRLRVDYLSNNTDFHWGVFRMFFDSSSYSQPEAVELLPLFTTYKERIPSDRTNLYVVESVSEILQSIAANKPRWTKAKPLPTTLPAEQPVEIKFISWKVHPPASGPEVRGAWSRPIVRNGKIWCSIDYYSTNGVRFYDHSANFLQIDPISGDCVEIPFPPELHDRGYYYSTFDVSKDSLFVIKGQRFMRYQLRDKKWTELHLPLESVTRMAVVNDSLYLGTDANLFELNPDTGSMQVLASSRRQPAVEELDAFWQASPQMYMRPPSSQIYPRADGQLGVQVTNRLFSFNPATRKWSTVQIPGAPDTYGGYLFISGDSAQWLTGGYLPYRQLTAFWNDRFQVELLLEQKDPRVRTDAAPDRSHGSPKWNWPEPFRMDCPLYAPDGKKLWVLNPRKELWSWTALEAPIAYKDNREATLLLFEPDRRDGRAVPLVFRKDGSVISPFADLHLMNKMDDNVPSFFATEQGVIRACRAWTGHWLISKTALENRLKPITLEQLDSPNASTNIHSASKP